jgi:hypothetical protein
MDELFGAYVSEIERLVSLKQDCTAAKKCDKLVDLLTLHISEVNKLKDTVQGIKRTLDYDDPREEEMIEIIKQLNDEGIRSIWPMCISRRGLSMDGMRMQLIRDVRTMPYELVVAANEKQKRATDSAAVKSRIHSMSNENVIKFAQFLGYGKKWPIGVNDADVVICECAPTLSQLEEFLKLQ